MTKYQGSYVETNRTVKSKILLIYLSKTPLPFTEQVFWLSTPNKIYLNEPCRHFHAKIPDKWSVDLMLPMQDFIPA